MAAGGPWQGLKSYARHLVAAVLFPFAWKDAWNLAVRHEKQDSRAKAKVGGAIVLGLLLAGASGYGVWMFRERAVGGIYASLDDDLVLATDEDAYQEQVSLIEVTEKSIASRQERLAAARTTGNADWIAANQTLLDALQRTLAGAVANRTVFVPNHDLYLGVHSALLERDDAGAKSLVEGSPLLTKAMKDSAAASFAVKDKAYADMDGFLLWLVWPGLVGAFYAPLVFALGSVLGQAFEPSDTVGFKKYPGAAMALFLLFGAFGVPALFFAAWSLKDMHGRSLEGQIAL